MIRYSLIATGLLAMLAALLLFPGARDTVAPVAAQPAPVARSAAAPVVLELFTSQGCSSCPPADRLVAQLAQRGDVIVISRPVTYWDRLGWHDTLADPANTALQRAYAQRGLAGYNGVYTPQAVIDGRAGDVGSSAGQVNAMIAAAAARSRPRLMVDRARGTVQISGTGTARAQLALVGLKASETVVIGRGENGNRTLHYTNVWRGEQALGTWNGSTQRFTLPATLSITGADRYALVLRTGESGPILAGVML